MVKLRIWSQKLAKALSIERRVWLTIIGVTGTIIALRWLGMLESWELAALDLLFRQRPLEQPEQRITIVEIGEAEIQEGNWPLPDITMAKLLEKLNTLKPRVIGLDIYRDLPIPPGFARLQEVMVRTPNFVAIELLEDQKNRGVRPPPGLQSKKIGFNNVVLDSDGKIRRSSFYWYNGDQLYTSFALRIALFYLAKEGIKPKPALENPQYLRLKHGVFPIFQSLDGGYTRTDAGGYQVLVNFRHPSLFTKVTMGDILAGKVDPTLIRDRIVIVGSTAPSLKDFASIPYSTNAAGSFEQINGVELHANFVSQIISAALDDRPLIRVWSEGLEWFWIALWTSSGALMVGQWRSPGLSALILIFATAALIFVVYFAFLAGWWLPIIPPLLGLGGSVAILMGLATHQQEELKRSTEFLQSIIDKIPDPVFVKDRNEHWLLLNEAFCQFSGYELNHLLGKSELDIFPPEEAQKFQEQDRWVWQTQQSLESEEKFTNSHGKTYLTATKRSFHQDAAGNLFLVGVIRDITKRKQLEEELRRTTVELSRHNAELNRDRDRLHHLAHYDSLTGLANRKHFYETLQDTLLWAQENQQLVGLLYLDLDGFKQVNDFLGHQLGDLLLKAVAGRLKNSVRGSDLVARLGGDEFTVILPGIKKPEDVIIVTDKIIATLSGPFMLEGNSVSIRASIGGSVYPLDGETEAVLIEKADRAMYQAKEQGRR